MGIHAFQHLDCLIHSPGITCKEEPRNNGSEPYYTTSSPAVDPNRQYVYSYGLDGHTHKHRVRDGIEITGGGWPQLTTLKPFDEKGSSALTIAKTKGGKSYLYVANGGYLGDRGDYQGHVTAIDLSNGIQRVFNANCSNQTVHFEEKPGKPDCAEVRSAIWGRTGVVYDEELNRIYAATGNGPFKPIVHCWGDTVVALNPDGTGENGDPLDSYTPKDYSALEFLDLDLAARRPSSCRFHKTVLSNTWQSREERTANFACSISII